jgi:V/A-type H+-transporting ATPase subunit I
MPFCPGKRETMILKMSKVEILGERKNFKRIVDLIYDMGVLHIEDLSDVIDNPEFGFSEMEMEEDQLAEKGQLEVLLGKLKQIQLLLPPSEERKKEEVSHEEPFDVKRFSEEWTPKLDRLLEEVGSLVKQRNQAQEKLTILSKYEEVFEVFSPLLEGFETMENHAIVGLTIEKKYEDAVMPILREELEKITGGQFHLALKEVTPDVSALAILFHKNYSKEVGSLLNTTDIHEIKMPSDLADRPFNEALSLLSEMKAELPDNLKELEAKIQDISANWYTPINELLRKVEDQLDIFKVFLNFAQTRHTFMMRGWIPTKTLSTLKNRLKEEVGETIVLNVLTITEEEKENIPVCVVHSPLIRPFEKLMSIFPLPKYNAIDPTTLLAVGFPIFFGMMLGDIAYGALFLGAALYLKFKYRAKAIIQDVMYILILCSISSIIFGFLYGELLGDFGEHFLGLHPIWKERLQAMVPLLYLSIGIGVFHVFLGLILGVVEAFRIRSRKQGIARAATMGTICAIFVLIAYLGNLLPKEFFTTGVVLILVSIPLLIYAEGFVGVLEIISVIGNILSYARLMAIGISSAIIAMVANFFGGALGNFVVAAIIVLLLHALNLALGIYSPTIQGLRLHYVEFFKQFFRYGGRQFTPFARGEGVLKG